MHSGYFANTEVARPFLDTISQAIIKYKPSVIADLGGGTGFILNELAKRHADTSIKFINIDYSAKQIEECKNREITSLKTSVLDIRRDMLIHDGHLMLIMRSLLHYFGYSGGEPFLKHLRSQMKPGEVMVHQTVCFESQEEADCANCLYTMMGTPKYYLTATGLIQTLTETDWQVIDSQMAVPRLILKSDELAERYGLSKKDVLRIREELCKRYGSQILLPDEASFTGFLHYRIFTCVARPNSE